MNIFFKSVRDYTSSLHIALAYCFVVPTLRHGANESEISMKLLT